VEKITTSDALKVEDQDSNSGRPSGIFARFFAMQYLLYFLLTMNYRAVAQARYGWTILTEMLISAAQFWIIRKVVRPKATSHGWVSPAGAALAQ